MDHAATVEEAVKRFYAAGTSEAHTWLLQVQASSEAWTFTWELLQPSKVNINHKNKRLFSSPEIIIDRCFYHFSFIYNYPELGGSIFRCYDPLLKSC